MGAGVGRGWGAAAATAAVAAAAAVTAAAAAAAAGAMQHVWQIQHLRLLLFVQNGQEEGRKPRGYADNVTWTALAASAAIPEEAGGT